MDASESKALFTQADTLYREGRYGEALEVLDRLDAAFPDTKNILMPRAMCLVHLGQVDQGREIYERLVQRYPAERLKKLRNLLKKASEKGPPPIPQPEDALDAVMNVNAQELANARITATPQAVKDARQGAVGERAAPAAEGPNWAKWAAIGGGALVVLALLVLPLFMEGSGPATAGESGGSPRMTEINESTIEQLPRAEQLRFTLVFLGVWGVTAIVFLPVPIFLTLVFFGELPRDTFWENYLVLTGLMLFIYVISGISWLILSLFFGGAASFGVLVGFLYSVHAVFQLGFVRTLIFIGFSVAVTAVQSALMMVIFRMFYFDVSWSFLF